VYIDKPRTMKLLNKILILTFMLVTFSSSIHARISPSDSIGVRTINQKSYIVHKVEKGETLYALSRKYNVQVQSIMDANPGSNNGINVGQELIIPTEVVVQENVLSPTIQEAQKDRIVHTVATGESLYLIGQKYNVGVNNIKEWNNLRSNSLTIGQKLTIYLSPEIASEINKQKEIRETSGKKIHVVSAGETLYSISTKYNISLSDLKEWNRLETNTISIGQELIVGYMEENKQKAVIVQDLEVEEEAPEDVEVQTIVVPEPDMVKADDKGEFKKVTEKGIAQVIEGSESTTKYLALHRNAPIGTIMQIKNEMNDLSVFVRIIGKIPDTDDNKNILIKVSKVAYDRLGAIDNQFPVEITYHP
jgi:LysM repeat protein